MIKSKQRTKKFKYIIGLNDQTDMSKSQFAEARSLYSEVGDFKYAEWRNSWMSKVLSECVLLIKARPCQAP